MIELGEYARTSSGTVYIYSFEEDLYRTVSVEREQEYVFGEHELISWVPIAGERVMESGPDDEDKVFGVVVTAGQRTALVKWDGATEPEVWRNTQLEPAWDQT